MVLDRLGLEPWHVARDKEAREVGIDLPRDAGHRDAWLAALAEHPRVLQRPIITADDGTTVVGRDEDAVSRVIAAETGPGTRSTKGGMDGGGPAHPRGPEPPPVHV